MDNLIMRLIIMVKISQMNNRPTKLRKWTTQRADLTHYESGPHSEQTYQTAKVDRTASIPTKLRK